MSSTPSLKFGARLPMFGDEASPETFEGIATTAETAGFTNVIAGDHIVFPSSIGSNHPSSGDHDNPVYMNARADCYDIFETLSYVAGVTDTIHLNTNVCIAPYRHPVILTKNALTLAALSKNRFELGIGAGWLEEEFEVLDVPYKERGRRTDEFLDIFTTALDHGEFEYNGEFYSFQETGFFPQPPLDNQPKIWIGGTSGASFRRTAEYGDAWAVSLETPAAVKDYRARLMNAWSDYNRDGEPDVAVREILHVDPTHTGSTDGALIGSADDIINTLTEYVDVGATHFFMTIKPDSLDDQLEQLELVGNEIIPSF